jgi:hypothetical protein
LARRERRAIAFNLRQLTLDVRPTTHLRPT